MRQDAPQPPRGARARRMHATLREVELNSSTRGRHGKVRLVTALVGSLLLVFALAMTVALHTSREWLDERLSSVKERVGLDITVEHITYDLIDGLTLEGVSIRAPQPHDMSLVIGQATSDLSLIEVLQSAPKPGSLTLKGVHAQGRVDDAALQWLKALRSSKKTTTEGTLATRWRGEVHVAEGSAELDVNAQLEGLPRTRQTLSLSAWKGTLTRDAALHFDAQGNIRIDEQERNAKMTFRTGPDAAFRLKLDDPVGLAISGSDVPMQVQVEGAQWSRRVGALQIDGLAIAHGEKRLAVSHVQLDGGAFPWVGGKAPRSLTLRGLTGEAAGHRFVVRGGSVTLVPPQSETGQYLPLPREVRLEEVELDAETHVLKAQARRVTLGIDQSNWRFALTDDPQRLVKSIEVQSPNVALGLAGIGLLEESAASVTAGTQYPEGSDPWRALAASDDALVIPGASSLIKTLKGRRVSVTRGNLVVHESEEMSADGLRFDNLSVTWAPALEGGGTASVNAGVRRGSRRSGRLDLTADVTRKGTLRSANGAISGPGLAHFLSRLSDYVTVEPDAWMQANFVYEHRPTSKERHHISGELRFEDFGFEAWRISHSPVRGLEGDLRYTGSIHPESRTLRFAVEDFHMAGARARGDLSVVLNDEGPAQVNASMALPKQDCGELARAIPPSLIPRLKGLELAGSMQANATFSVDLSDPNSVTLDVGGAVRDCRVVTLGGDIDLDALRGKFIHHPVEPKRGRRDDIEVGRGTQQWIEKRQLPHYLRAAAVMTEDRSFYSHQGVRWDLIAAAIKLNLEQEGFAYGGSTITQQLVKNLYLTREKTLSRKLEELVISWELERRYDKEEILELYVNVIEFGPDIYGVRKAAHYYFGKPPWHLSPAESAFIMGLKPYPRAGHRQWQAQSLNAWWQKRVRNVVKASGQSLSGGPKLLKFRAPGASFWSGMAGATLSSTGEAPDPAP